MAVNYAKRYQITAEQLADTLELGSPGTTKSGKRTVNFKDGEGRNRSVHATAILSVR